MQAEPTLRALRDRPFELLQLLEKRARDLAAGAREGAAAQEWIGVALPASSISAVVPALQTRSWKMVRVSGSTGGRLSSRRSMLWIETASVSDGPLPAWASGSW